MRGIALFFCFATLLGIKNIRALQVDYMNSYKTGIVLRTPSAGYFSSGILKSHDGFTYPTGMNKTFNVSAPSGYSLVVSIRLIDLRPSSADKLTIFDTNGLERPVTFQNTGYFKNKLYYPKEQITFFARNGQVGIRFTTGRQYFTLGYEGFELVYTVVGIDGFHCFSDDFRCKNGRCIAYELRCDDHNHCGDQSDLKSCKTGGSVSKIGISLGVVFLVIAAACGIYIVIRRSRGGDTDTHTVITSHPPPNNLPSYPPAYPQPGVYYPPPPPPYSQGIANPAYR